MRAWLGGLLGIAVVGMAGWRLGLIPLGTSATAAAHPTVHLASTKKLTRKKPVLHKPAPPKPVPHKKSPVLSLKQPTAAHPLTILAVGDSLGEDLQYGLQYVTGASPLVHIIPEARGSSGLAVPAYYNWPVSLAADLKRYHPQLVVVLLGGNDAVNFDQNGQFVAFGSPLWKKDYGQRVAQMMSEARHSGAQVLWVGAPIMANFSVLHNKAMEMLNQVYMREAALHPGVAYVSSWSLFQAPHGGFTEYLKDGAGQSVMVRDPDGVHIAPPYGDELIGDLALTHIETLGHISLCIRGTNPWPQFHLPSCGTP